MMRSRVGRSRRREVFAAACGALFLALSTPVFAAAEEQKTPEPSPSVVASTMPTGQPTGKPRPSLAQINPKPNVETTAPEAHPTPTLQSEQQLNATSAPEAGMTRSSLKVSTASPSPSETESASALTERALSQTISKAPDGPPPVPRPLPTYNVQWVDAARQAAVLDVAFTGANALMDVHYESLRGADPLIWVVGGAATALLGLCAIIALAAPVRD